MSLDEVRGGAPPARHVALYVRVSTEDQDLHGQERELREFCTLKGWEVVDVYQEKRSAWSGEERPEFERMLREAASGSGKWDMLVVWAWDRFSRDPRPDVGTGALYDLEGMGKEVTFLRDTSLSTNTHGDIEREINRRILLGVNSGTSWGESARRSYRVSVASREIREGRRHTRSGRPWGRPRRVTREKLDQLIKLRQEGLRWKAISLRVQLPEGTCGAAYSKWRYGHLNADGLPSTSRPERPELSSMLLPYRPKAPSTKSTSDRGESPPESI